MNTVLALAITMTLSVGSRGPQVSSLQSYLATDRSVYPEGLVTGYYGPLTKNAVARFQSKNGLPAVGIVGPLTRALLAQRLGVLGQNPSQNPNVPQTVVCNTKLIGSDGFDTSRMITKEACDLVNSLYSAGKAAGNSGDTYENRDGLHVNFCEGWTPSPDCPLAYRQFPQHSWRLLNQGGAAQDVATGVTLGQASNAGFSDSQGKHSLTRVMYGDQTHADKLYQQYTHNNLYAYPALEESHLANIANTPYVVATAQYAKAGTDYYHLHDASGSEFPFIKLALLGLASLKPEVNAALKNDGRLIATLEMLIRESYKGTAPNDGVFMAHELVNGLPQPLYDSAKLVRIANDLQLSDVPPLVSLSIDSESFSSSEKYFTTPGAIARKSTASSLPKTIKVTVNGPGLEYDWKVLRGNAKVVPNGASAEITFNSGTPGTRTDVAVFIRRPGGKYYSMPGIISTYIE